MSGAGEKPEPNPAGNAPAPLGLRPEEVALLIEELEPWLIGARVEKIFDISRESYLFRFRGPQGRIEVYFTVRSGFARFHAVSGASIPKRPASPSEEAVLLRELLRQGRVTRLAQPNGDRLLRIDFEVPRDGKRRERCLVHELFGSTGRLLVTDGDQRRARFVVGRGGLNVGERYRFPEPPAKPKDLVTFPFDPRNAIPWEQRENPLAFQELLAERMFQAERTADFEEKRQSLQREVRRQRKRIRGVLAKQDAARGNAEKWQEQQRYGELLKGQQGQLQRGMKQVKVVDYYDAALPEVTIPLDPEKAPQANIEQYFKKARKGKRSLEGIEERRRQCEADLQSLDAADELLREAKEDRALEEARERLRGLELGQGRGRGSAQRKSRKGERHTQARGPKKYRSREGLEIWAGRSARENDQLTRTLASGNDLFFHIAHKPGPHVILRVPRGKNASPESIDDAAFLAAYLSGWRGPGKAIVHWTHVKFIRKPKGLPAGTVLLQRDREYVVEYQPQRMSALVLGESEAQNP